LLDCIVYEIRCWDLRSSGMLQNKMKEEDCLNLSGSWKPLSRLFRESRSPPPPQQWWLAHDPFEDHNLLPPLPRYWCTLVH
jgi:hypothetical protein